MATNMFHRGFLIAWSLLPLCGTVVAEERWGLTDSIEVIPDFVPEASVLASSHVKLSGLAGATPVSFESEVVAETQSLESEPDWNLSLTIEEPRPRAFALSQDPVNTASFTTFVGEFHYTDIADGHSTRIRGGTHGGVRFAMSRKESNDLGTELVLIWYSGGHRGLMGPEEIELEGSGMPDSKTRNSIWGFEYNGVQHRANGPYHRRTYAGIRVVSTEEEMDSFYYLTSGFRPSHPIDAFPLRERLQNALIALQFGWESENRNRPIEYSYGVRSAIGLGLHTRESVLPTRLRFYPNGFVEPVYESWVSSTVNLGTLAEYYLSSTYAINDSLSATIGLYGMSLAFVDGAAGYVSGDDMWVRHLVGVQMGAACVF